MFGFCVVCRLLFGLVCDIMCADVGFMLFKGAPLCVLRKCVIFVDTNLREGAEMLKAHCQ